MDNLDVKRIQEDAFSAIDNLFSDGKESKDEDFIKLKEKILTLDWEFNPDDIKEIINILNTLKNKYTDKVNSVLISMMINISKFLLVAKEKSPSDTLNVLAYIIDFFARLNEEEITVKEKKKYIAEIKSKYIKIKNAFTKLQPDSDEKQKAPEVEDQNKEKIVSKQESIIKSETESLSQEKQIEKQEVFVIEDEKKQENIREALDDVAKESIKVENIDFILDKLMSKIEYNLSTIIEENFKYVTEKLRKFEERLEDIAGELQIIKKDFKDTSSLEKQDYQEDKVDIFLDEKGVKKESKVIEDGDTKLILDGKDDFEIELKEDMDVVDLDNQEKQKEENKEEIFSFEEVFEDTETKENNFFQENEILPYVKIFKIKNKLLAIDDSSIGGIFKLSPLKANSLYKKERFKLKEIKTLFSSLAKHVRGSFSNLKEKELKNLEVEVYKYPEKFVDKFKYMILIDYEKPLVLFVRDIVGNNIFLPKNKISAKDVDSLFNYKVAIAEIGEVEYFEI
ncbi:hypothetical protein [Desulfonauticus submarinus]